MKQKLLALLMLSTLVFAGCSQQSAAGGSSQTESDPQSTASQEATSGDPSSDAEAQTSSDETSSEETANQPEGGKSLEEIAAGLYDGIDEMPKLGNMEITAENEQYYLGTTGLNFTEALASEAMITSIAHSVCLVRMADGEDIEAAKAQIKEKCDPRKWICVGVEPEDVIVDNVGNVIILIMTEFSPEQIHENFLSLAAE